MSTPESVAKVQRQRDARERPGSFEGTWLCHQQAVHPSGRPWDSSPESGLIPQVRLELTFWDIHEATFAECPSHQPEGILWEPFFPSLTSHSVPGNLDAGGTGRYQTGSPP